MTLGEAITKAGIICIAAYWIFVALMILGGWTWTLDVRDRCPHGYIEPSECGICKHLQ